MFEVNRFSQMPDRAVHFLKLQRNIVIVLLSLYNSLLTTNDRSTKISDLENIFDYTCRVFNITVSFKDE